MTKSDEYIVVTGSRNLNGGDGEGDTIPHSEDDGASLRAMESSGISIIGEDEIPTGEEPLDDLSRELLKEGGIEIVRREDMDEDEAFL